MGLASFNRMRREKEQAKKLAQAEQAKDAPVKKPRRTPAKKKGEAK